MSGSRSTRSVASGLVVLAILLGVGACAISLPGQGASAPGSGRALDADDGVVPAGHPLSPFDDVPAISKLDPDLLDAVREAAQAAEADGFEFFVESGWRSADYQQSLFDDAVDEYGSASEAERHVSTPEDSHHVSGEAVDIGPTDAMSWLQQHGDRFSLCQPFSNEMWHWELAPAPGEPCPPQSGDAG
ncbi:MAG: hypothetical protein RI885_675 [Actinomycetota bacterium]|jgi:hypothetical protein